MPQPPLVTLESLRSGKPDRLDQLAAQAREIARRPEEARKHLLVGTRVKPDNSKLAVSRKPAKKAGQKHKGPKANRAVAGTGRPKGDGKK